MIETKEHFEELGMFETYCGELLIYNQHLILPMYNIQLAEHPLNQTPQEVVYLDFGIAVFKNVLSSQRKVFLTKNGEHIESFVRTDYLNTGFDATNAQKYLLELLDYQNGSQYWDWWVEAETFSFLVMDNHSIQKQQFDIHGIKVEVKQLLRNQDIEMFKPYI